MHPYDAPAKSPGHRSIRWLLRVAACRLKIELSGLENGPRLGGSIITRIPGYITSIDKWLLRIKEAGFERIIGLGVDDAGKG